MRVRPADAVAGSPASRTLVRAMLLALAVVLTLAALALSAYALAAARVPQQRAALESLLRAETGFDVRFGTLQLRWGWYGPEALFRAVELREPGAARPLLAAPELVLSIDLWRMLRSGDLTVGRITLLEPDIDLTRERGAGTLHAPHASAPLDWAGLLSSWRGSRIDLLGGRLRADLAGGPLMAAIREMQLRRSGAHWSAQALLTLPESLGASVRASLALHGEAAGGGGDLEGVLSLSGSRLQLAGWRQLLHSTPGADFLPGTGNADLTLRIGLAHGTIAAAQGSIEASSLGWDAPEGLPAPLALDTLQADWHLERSGSGWHLTLAPLGLGSDAPARAAVSLDAAADGSWVRGRVQNAPAAVLAVLVARLVPQLRLSGLEVAGLAREARFDWSDARPPGTRLRTSADLVDLSISSPGRALVLSGLAANLSGVGSSIDAQLHADAARLVARGDPNVPESLSLSGRIALDDSAGGWRVDARELDVRAKEGQLLLTAAFTGEDSGAHPRLEAHATLNGVPVELARTLLGTRALAALGSAAGELIAGRIEHAELVVRGPLDESLPWSGPHTELSGSLTLSGAHLAGVDDRPDLEGLDARIEWRGSHVRAAIARASAGGFSLAAARAEWDARTASLTRFSGRLSGDAGEALAWLRQHPRLEASAPGIGVLALRGPTSLDLKLRRGPSASTHLTARLDGAQLSPVAGLPAIDGLRGTLTVADGRLQRSTLTGQWLGGPIALSFGERREHGVAALGISGRGQLDVRGAIAAATGAPDSASPLQGTADWSADLELLPTGGETPPTWHLRADSVLAGVASALPEPFDKAAGSALPLHLELRGSEDAAVLRVGLGERLRGLAAVARRGALWQIERGTLSFAPGVPALPAVPVVRVEGTLSRLDLPAYAALWRQLPRNPAWPAVQVDVHARELVAGERSFADMRVQADTGAGFDELRLESAALEALLRRPPVVDADHPVSARIERLDLSDLTGGTSVAALFAVLGPVTQVRVGELLWQGRALGPLTARVASRGEVVEASELHIGGAPEEAHGTVRCAAQRCAASFSLETHDAAATLARLGFRADLAASHAAASGELEWAADAPSFAAVHGRLHLSFEDGVTRAGAPEAAASVLGLLTIPELVSAMGLPELPFVRLSGDFALAGGEATTSNLHLDGDTEILLRGRIGLLAHDYAAEAWVLKGEERLPGAVRGLAPGPRLAALWMSLREFFGGADRERARLRLRGTWDDPMVTAGE